MHRPTAVSRPQSPTARAVIPAASLQRKLMARPRAAAPPGGMGGSSFTAGEESVTLDFANAEITKNDESIELSDLAEGDILFNGYTITLADGTVLK